MLKIFSALFLIVFSWQSIPLNAGETPILTINILSRELFNGAGKEADALILKEELNRIGHRVNFFDFLEEKTITPADINVFLAKFETNLFPTAKFNWLLVNPDFCYGSLNELQKFDLIICKTEESCRIFNSINIDIYFLGFTSIDCHIPSFSKNFSKMIHIAGKSPMKGTEEVFEAWGNDPSLPEILVIKHNATIKDIPKNVQLI